MTAAVAEDVARHSLAARPESLDSDVQQAALDLLLDAIGVGIAGITSPESSAALRVVSRWGHGSEAAIWGINAARLPAGSAAFVNAHQMHCLEFDAINEPAVVHPTTVVLPVISAWAQRARASGSKTTGRDFLSAFVVGIDVAAGLGDVVTTPLQFFRPATAGALGAVAALCNLSRPDFDAACSALGIVYGALSGTMQPHTEGAQVLALQVAFNARAALHSLDLAEGGFQGPRYIFEGKYGYFRLIEGHGDPQLLVRMLGRQSQVTRTSVKPFPSGRATHAALDAVLSLRDEYTLRPGDVAKVEIDVPPMVHGLVGRVSAGDLVPGAARLCLPYLVSYTLRYGRVDLGAYRSECLRDPDVLELAARVEVRPDANPDPNAFNPQTVRIVLADGRTLERTMHASLGSPECPLDRAGLRAKFEGNLAAAGRQDVAGAIADQIAGLVELDDVEELLRLL